MTDAEKNVFSNELCPEDYAATDRAKKVENKGKRGGTVGNRGGSGQFGNRGGSGQFGNKGNRGGTGQVGNRGGGKRVNLVGDEKRAIMRDKLLEALEEGFLKFLSCC